MASGLMMSKTAPLSSIGRANKTAFTPTRMVAPRRCTVVVKAAQQPNDIAMGMGKALGALAAVQLALLPVTGPAMADLLPKTATSESARKALNAKTSALPSLKQTVENAGEALSGDVDLQSNVQRAGQNLKDAAGGDLGSQAKSNAKGFLNKAKSATGGDLGSQAKGAFNKAKSATGNDLGSQAKDNAKGLFNKAKSQAGSFPNPAREFANRAKGAADRASAAVTDNPAKEFANRGKAAVRENLPNLPVDGPAEWDMSSLQVNVSQKLQAQASSTAKQVGSKAKSAVQGVPDPSQFVAKAKQAAKKVSGSVPSNPAADFAAKAKQAGNKVSGGAISNPARDFANAAKKAKAKVTNNSIQLPVVAAPSVFDYSTLQKDVGFLGFGDKAKKAASKAGSVADDMKDSASSVADKASDIASSATPDKSFNIFDSGSVQNARDTLKANVEKAASEARDPAERVFPIGRPGETQEENAERIRVQSENAATPMGDARAPTN